MRTQRRTILDNIPMLVAIFVVFFTSVQCQKNRVASTSPQRVTGQEGDKVDLLCTFGRGIYSCRFEFPNDQKVKLNPQWNRQDPNFEYYGAGLENGQCGVTIKSLTRDLEGNITCVLDLNDGTEDIVGVIPVEIARAPGQPLLYVSNEKKLEAGQEMQAECEFHDGHPAALVSWFLGNERLTSKNNEFHNQDKDTVVSSIFHRLSPEDDLKPLICRLDHPAFADSYTNTSLQLNVNYQPVPLSRDELYITGLEIGQTVDIMIKIRAKPRPRLLWTVDGTNYDERSQTPKYLVNQAEQAEDGRWIAKLTVVDLTLADTLKTYLLRASNEFGATDYSVRIGGAKEVDDSGLGIVPIIAIAIVSIFVLIVIALLVVARITKRWCFAGASLHPNSPDSEAQIAPEEDKTHEHYEQHESKVTDDESADVEHNGKSNGKTNGNTSV